MVIKRYKLRVLPLFEDDLNEAVDYIALRLKKPVAAENLVNAVQEAIRERTTCAEAFEAYHSMQERQYPYYRIHVKNYIVFYVVIGDVMEVRRLIYNRRNLPEQV